MNNSDGQLVYLPSFKAKNSSKYTSVFAIAADNLKYLYIHNRNEFTDFQNFITSLESLLKIEFEIQKYAQVHFVILTEGETIVFASEESMDERSLLLQNNHGYITLSTQE